MFPERKGWFQEYYHDSQAWTPPGYRHWAEYEDRATTVRTWVGGMIHGLAQTPEYARAHLLTFPNVPTEMVTKRLTARTIHAESYRASESADILGRMRDLWTRGESPLTAERREDRA